MKMRRAIWLIFTVLLFSETILAARTSSGPCEKGSCLPGTGNLLIGRENRLWASSTCGLRNQEKFCIVTSLEEQKKCYWCDSRPTIKGDYKDYRFAHRIENVVSKTYPSSKKQTWWQSQNGVENVTIQLDLEAEFYFTYLYMKFKTFRPAACVVERSYDYGLSWKIYRYFAFDCAKYFPYALKGSQDNLTLAYCDEHYSTVTPLTGGEVILRILPTTLDDIDPYSDDIQNLVKITNLRINFTKLHTLGDDLLDNRPDLQEKYYYAISEMVVGGSCSCYGHANRCVPQEGVESKPNMVHGKCECNHNTKGLNCGKCEDLYNDLEWAPAIGKKTNACKKCNCNEHATSCHFDSKIFEATGRVSGGMCDNCLHNTMGKNCEQCKHFYYQDTSKDFTDPNVCLECDCDPAGSLDEGICDSKTDPANNLVSGRCHCKANVEGRRCDTCKNGFWNFTESNSLGCQTCSCNILGTYANQGCNKDTGECLCKRNVIGRDCNQCVPEFWGLGDSPEGCKPCDCDKGGSLDTSCDVITGQCRCRANITGRTCNVPEQTYFIPPLEQIIEIEAYCKPPSCTLDNRLPSPTGDSGWTGTRLSKIYANTTLEFPIDNIKTDLLYELTIRYEPQPPYNYEQARIILLRPGPPSGYCENKIENEDNRDAYLAGNTAYTIVNPPFCLEAGKNYTLKISFLKVPNSQDSPTASILIDSVILTPHIESVEFLNENDRYEFERNRCKDAVYSVVKTNLSEICKAYHFSIGSYIYGGGSPCLCDSTGSRSSVCDPVRGYCDCKPNVVGRQCDRCAPGTYGFGPDGCKACDCNSIGSLDNFCDVFSGQCRCQPQTYGRMCDKCQPGSWNYPNCQKCICHGHADICEPSTGVCIDCKNSTAGHHCDRCIEGFYGDPRIGVDIPCRMCPCPGTVETGHSFAQRCELDPRNQDVICECDIGYTGLKCERCLENYFGNPEIIGGKCEQCNCSNNIDIARPGNCDPSSGRCLQCLYNTEGFNCEYCRAGFYGDALQQSCSACVCDILGTDAKFGPCDKFTGQCPCLPNVTGLQCDQCIKNHWKIASGAGCESCACDPVGSISEQCNQFDGQCDCRQGFGGRQCNQCQTNYWGNPNKECFQCECNPEGSVSMQCNQTTGYCHCMLGIGGEKCNKCARGFLGEMPTCSSCGECFDNWDLILKNLKEQTKAVIDKASEIMKIGARGSYSKEFENMEAKLTDVKQRLKNTTASTLQVQELDNLISELKAAIIPPEKMNDVNSQANNVTQRITLALLALEDLKKKADGLNSTTQSLKDNGTKLQEANVEGALNLTREAFNKTFLIKNRISNIESVISETKKSCARTENLLSNFRTQYTETLDESDEKLLELTKIANNLETEIPNLNLQVCDKGGNPCDDLCGGAGCGFCGGLSCENGALTKTEGALKFAKDATKLVEEKEVKINELLRAINQGRIEAKNAFNATQFAVTRAEVAKNESDLVLNKTNNIIKEVQKFVNSSGTAPTAIRNVAEETMNKSINLQPEKITELAQKINDTISSLTNIDAIIRETEGDLNNAKRQKLNAEDAKQKAESALKVTEKVVTVLNQTENSQKKAESAIETANKNITSARRDLSKISEQNIKTSQTINETAEQLKILEENFKSLQTEFLKNSADAEKVESELKGVTSDVDDTQKKTSELTQNYEQIAAELSKRAKNSTEARTNAQILLEKASQLSLNTTNKLKDLQELDRQFQEENKDLELVNKEIQSLTEQMDRIFEAIKGKWKSYDTCP